MLCVYLSELVGMVGERERPEGVELVRVLSTRESLLRLRTRSGLVHRAQYSAHGRRRFPHGRAHVALLPQGPTPIR